MKVELRLTIEWKDDVGVNALYVDKLFDLEWVPPVGEDIEVCERWPFTVTRHTYCVDDGFVRVFATMPGKGQERPTEDARQFEQDGWGIEWDEWKSPCAEKGGV